jgi:hypothetical protein
MMKTFSSEHHPSSPVSRRGMLLQLTAAGAVLGDERALGAVHPPAVSLAAVSTVEALRTQAIPSSAAAVLVQDFRQNGDGGGGTFCWDVASTLPDDGGVIIQPAGAADKPGRWRRQTSGPVNPKWFGALGDGSGRAPQDDSIDIATAPWNRFPAWTKTADYSPAFLGWDQSKAPFQNTDSWDFIGIQLALWSVGERYGEVAIPGGTFLLTRAIAYTNRMRATLSGAGMYQTVLSKKAGFFNNDYVLRLYRIGGVPTVVRDLCFSGPFGGGTTSFTLIDHANTNGVHIQSCWLSVCQTGIDYRDHSGDAYVKDCTAEYCEVVVRVDATSDVVIDGCNFWQSAAGVKYTGVKSLGAVRCQNTRFVGFGGACIDSSGPLHATGNEFTSEAGPVSLLMSSGADSVISANRFRVGSLSAMVWVGSHSTVTGNSFHQTSPHACLNITQGATRTVVSGNVFRYVGKVPIVEGGLVVSVEQDVSWKTGCSQCLITGNSFDGANGINVDTSPARSNQVSDNL